MLCKYLNNADKEFNPPNLSTLSTPSTLSPLLIVHLFKNYPVMLEYFLLEKHGVGTCIP